MPALNISAAWEHLDQGTPEEKACFSALGIQSNDMWLTEGVDAFVNRVRTEPLLSAYHLAEWFAWNWWRLRWEPPTKAPDWAFAHRTSTIGEGYVWPNITIFSDGERTALIAKPSAASSPNSFRYISDVAAVVPSRVFEAAIDGFVGQVIGQLRAEQVEVTNLDRLWTELSEERGNRETSRRRKLEALLGKEPDDEMPTMIDRLIEDSRFLGERAIEEIAAHGAQSGQLPTADDLRRRAEINGYATSRHDTVKFRAATLEAARDIPAWKLGVGAARLLREQEGFGDGPLSNQRLAEIAGVETLSLSEDRTGPDFSFILDQTNAQGKIVFRSKWESGRRFELARLLADRLVNSPTGRLHAATRANTYRQKMQRSFAAEFLSPFQAVDAMLDGDYSPEMQSEVAKHFQVSSLTIQTLLLNHRRLERESMDDDCIESAA